MPDFWGKLMESKDKEELDVPENIKEAFPSTEELQANKKKRQGYIESLHDTAVDAGVPTLGSAVAAGLQTANDMFSPEDRDDYMRNMMPAVGGTVGKAAGKEAGVLGKLAEAGPPKARPVVWKDALLDPNKLATVVENPAAANEARAFEEKSFRAASQKNKDVAAGIKKPGSTTAQSEAFPERDYSVLNKIEQQPEGPSYNYQDMKKKIAPSKGSYVYDKKGNVTFRPEE